MLSSLLFGMHVEYTVYEDQYTVRERYVALLIRFIRLPLIPEYRYSASSHKRFYIILSQAVPCSTYMYIEAERQYKQNITNLVWITLHRYLYSVLCG